MSVPMDLTWEREGKQYHFQEYPESKEVRISVVDNEGYPCHEQVVLPLAIWNAIAYIYVANDRKQPHERVPSLEWEKEYCK